MRSFRLPQPSTLITIALLIVVGIYAYARSATFRAGPVLNLATPTALVSEDNVFTIVGDTENISFIYLNGEQIFTNPQGEFDEEVRLGSGKNLFTIEVWDRFDRRRHEQITIWRPAPDSALELAPLVKNELEQEESPDDKDNT